METMLVAVDYAGCGEEVVRQAASMAARLEQRVVLLHVMSLPPGVAATDHVHTCDACAYQDDATALEGLSADASAQLDALSRAFTSRNVPTTIELRAGEAAPSILAAAQTHAASLIAVGTHGRKGLGRAMFGSVAEKVLRDAPCPVLAIRVTGAPRGPTATQQQIMAEGDG